MDVARHAVAVLDRAPHALRWHDLEALRAFETGSHVLCFHGPLALGPRAAGAPDGRRAFDAILADVIALANARGGDVLIGAVTAPADARRIVAWAPFADCRRAASHLARLLHERIEPRVARLSVAGIPRDDGAAGVVLIRVPASRLAPHRCTASGRAYVRDGATSRVLDVREAQALAFRVARDTARVESRLAELRTRARRQAAPALGAPDAARRAIRVSAVPTCTLALGRDWLWSLRDPLAGADAAASALRWRRRPILRGMSWRLGTRTDVARVEMWIDGAATFWIVEGRTSAATPAATTIARAVLAIVGAMRAASGERRVEYALDVQRHGALERTADTTLPLYCVGDPGLEATVLDLLTDDLAGPDALQPR